MILPYRNHISSKKVKLDLKTNYSKNDSSIKPIGFWFSLRDDWYNFLIDEMNIKPKYIYEVKLKYGSLTTIDKPDYNKIVQIKTIDDWTKLRNKYIITNKKNKYDWSKLKKHFGGIEITNHNTIINKIKIDIKSNDIETLRKTISDNITLMSWDVDGGCIWNLDILESIELIN